MLYYLFSFLDSLDFPGAGMFQFISFRSGVAAITSLIITMVYGRRIIAFLQKKQIGETVRDLNLQGQKEKSGTPTMGGLIIIGGILIPTLLFARLSNVYVILMIITTIWLGFIGFIDDYIKVFRKNKEGLKGRAKIVGQIGIGLIVGLTLFFSPSVVVREKTVEMAPTAISENITEGPAVENVVVARNVKSTRTTIPFLKNNEFDYAWLTAFLGKGHEKWAWLAFVLVTIFIITAVSNGANITDGLDGLATGTSAIIVATLGLLAYVSGNLIFSEYLKIMYIPNIGELAVFTSAFLGATVGFLWYNSYPAQVFMGDTGSLTLGGVIAVLAIIIRKELLIPVLCGIFLIENLSVVMQVGYFKYTRKRFGEGRRIFKMSPLHHHFQLLGIPENKIVIRFWIVGLLLALITIIITLKVR
jgi:phospho-N-acetylmuramoyl-pentapeptide-transferase